MKIAFLDSYEQFQQQLRSHDMRLVKEQIFVEDCNAYEGKYVGSFLCVKESNFTEMERFLFRITVGFHLRRMGGERQYVVEIEKKNAENGWITIAENFGFEMDKEIDDDHPFSDKSQSLFTFISSSGYENKGDRLHALLSEIVFEAIDDLIVYEQGMTVEQHSSLFR